MRCECDQHGVSAAKDENSGHANLCGSFASMTVRRGDKILRVCGRCELTGDEVVHPGEAMRTKFSLVYETLLKLATDPHQDLELVRENVKQELAAGRLDLAAASRLCATVNETQDRVNNPLDWLRCVCESDGPSKCKVKGHLGSRSPHYKDKCAWCEGPAEACQRSPCDKLKAAQEACRVAGEWIPKEGAWHFQVPTKAGGHRYFSNRGFDQDGLTVQKVIEQLRKSVDADILVLDLPKDLATTGILWGVHLRAAGIQFGDGLDWLPESGRAHRGPPDLHPYGDRPFIGMVPKEALEDPMVLAVHRANTLADECQKLTDENRDLLAENGRLRRELERRKR